MKPIALFIHGALSTRRSFNYIKSELYLQEQVDNTYLFQSGCSAKDFKDALSREYKDFSYDIREEDGHHTVDRLIKQVKGYVKSAAEQTIAFVCHSFGGVLGVSAARQLKDEFPDLNLKIVTLATPLGGSAAASVLRVLKPSSTFFKNIGAYDGFMRSFNKLTLPCRTRAIVTTEGHADWLSEPNDGVVTVESQLAFESDPHFHPIKVKLNHFEVLMAPEAVNQVKKELVRS